MNRKIRYKRLIIFLFFIIVFVFIILKLMFLKITNIYVSGNTYLTAQEIIELGKISNYPNALFTFSNFIESNIRKSDLVDSVDVKKKGFTKVYISVKENRPLFYDDIQKKTVLMDGKMLDKVYNVPVLVNIIDKDVYSKFLSLFSNINSDVFSSISEIEYTPNVVDKELFLLTMNDGNYIYVNLNRFDSINKYFDMMVNFNNHKGILYLDSGEYFKILDN